MTPLLAVLIGLTQLACPPDVGQIKWSGLSLSFSAKGARYQIEATVWDRDRNGKVSAKDLVRIDGAQRKGEGLGISDAWFTLGGGLAAQLEKARKRASALRAACESDFDVEGVPRVASPAALAGRLDAWGGVQAQSPTERLEADLEVWAAERCRGDAHVERAELERFLAARGIARHKGVGQKRVKAIAHEVSQRWAMECAHLKVPPKLTFE